MQQRWATFDCYGTLIDWNGGIGDALYRLWPEVPRERLLKDYHAIEPLVQSGQELPYRQVLGRCLRAIAAVEDLPLGEQDSHALADSLPSWPAFPEVPPALRRLRERGWQLAILSNTDPALLDASLMQIGVPVDETITVVDARSYKPARGHWDRFFERTGAERGRHVHVAASLFHDIAPAHELGIPAIWINRLAEQSDLPRAGELRDLTHLDEALEALVPE